MYYVYCNDRIYIQSIDDVVYHDVRFPDVLFYIDLSKGNKANPVKLVFIPSTGFAVIPKSTGIKVSFIGGVFTV